MSSAHRIKSQESILSTKKDPQDPWPSRFRFSGKLQSITWWYQKSVERYDSPRSLTASLRLKHLPGPKWRGLSSNHLSVRHRVQLL